MKTLKKQLKKTRAVLTGSRGNITIITAMSLTLLIMVMALVVDGGHLYSTKNRYQNGVDAAATAAAHHIADGFDQSTGEFRLFRVARDIARKNGIPDDTLSVKIGYYDPETLEFTEDPDPTTMKNETLDEEDEEITILNNAVLVKATRIEDTFLAGIFGSDTVTVSAERLVYGRRNTFTATTTDEDTPGIDLTGYRRTWPPGYGQYRNVRMVSNNPVVFSENQTEVFKNSTIETNAGVIGAGGNAGLDIIETDPALEPKTIDWKALRAKAEANGFVYSNPESWPNQWTIDEFGNAYKRTEEIRPYSAGVKQINYFFLPAGSDNTNPEATEADGDHEGRTYFFEIPEEAPPDFPGGYILRLWNDNTMLPKKRTCWNFTIAARCRFSTYPSPYNSPCHYVNTTLGNFPELGGRGLVYIYAKDCDEYSTNWYTQNGLSKVTEPNGVVFHAEGDFHMEVQKGDLTTFYLRVHAGNIHIEPRYNDSTIRFDGAFGPFTRIMFGKYRSQGG